MSSSKAKARDEEEPVISIKENERRRLGTEAIEQLASGLNLAANTIEGFSQNVSFYFWPVEECSEQLEKYHATSHWGKNQL